MSRPSRGALVNMSQKEYGTDLRVYGIYRMRQTHMPPDPDPATFPG